MIQLAAIEFEKALIACALLAPPTIIHADDVVSHEDFGDASLGRLWSQMRIGYHAGVQIGDIVVLMDYLRKSNADPEFLCTSFWADIASVGIPANVKWYGIQVRQAAMLRKLYNTCQQISHQCSLPRADASELIEQCSVALQSMQTNLSKKTVMIGEAFDKLLDSLKARGTEKARGSFTGIERFDSACGAMMPTELVVLAARPGMGKTAMAMQIARHNCEKGRRVMYVSLEMSDLELASRILCADARVPSQKLRQPFVSKDDIDRLSNSSASLRSLPLELFAPPTASVDQIKVMAKSIAAKNDDLRLVIVDYIGIVQPADRREPRYEQVGRISRSLKELAREIEVPVLALCQLNREADSAKPKLSYLRDSGSIEQDADVVMFLHRDAEADRTNVGLYVEKHRHAGTMHQALRFIPSETRFADFVQKHEEFDDFNDERF